MTPADTPAFRAALRRLETAFGCPVDDARDPVFFDALANFPITTVMTAARDLERQPPPSRRMPTTHDWRDRCHDIRHAEAHAHPTRTSCPEPHDDTPPMSKQEFFARLETLRKKLARVHPAGARRHSSLIPLSQIAGSLTHPHAIPADAAPPRSREPGDDDLPLDETPVHTNGAEDDPDAVS